MAAICALAARTDFLGCALQSRYKLSFYDALIVAAALESGCKRLLSEDTQHGLRIEKLVIVNPFAGD